jgi:hydrogenase maturation factor
MKTGKVPENVLKRSVFKQIKSKREEVLSRPGVGEDCAVMALEPDEVFVLSTDPITGAASDIGTLAVHVTANDLASAGAEPVGLLLSVLLPPSAEEADLKALMGEIESACEPLNIEIMGGHTEVTPVVNQPVVTVTGVGKVKKNKVIFTKGARPGQDIVITKWVGLEGTSIIAAAREAELRKHYSQDFVDRAKGFIRYISVVKEALAAREFGVSAMHDITEGGVFGALWEVASAGNVGLTVDLKKVPLKQETVEICEFFDLNPYQLISSGSMLIACDRGHDLVEYLKKMDIHSAVVGKFTDSNDKVIVYDEGETRYLEPPKTDELYKI